MPKRKQYKHADGERLTVGCNLCGAARIGSWEKVRAWKAKHTRQGCERTSYPDTLPVPRVRQLLRLWAS